MVDTGALVVEGYRVPFNTIYKRVKEMKQSCNCPEPGVGKYCSSCGSKIEAYWVTEDKFIATYMDEDQFRERDPINGTDDIFLFYPFGDFEEGCDYAVLGKLVVEYESYECSVRQLKNCTDEVEIGKVAKDKEIPIIEGSFGMYFISEAY